MIGIYRVMISNRILFYILILTGTGMTSCEDALPGIEGGDPRDRLVDTWKVEDTAGGKKSGMGVYYVDISKHFNDSSRIVIHNFYDVSSEAEAILSGTKLTLPIQQLEGGFTISGKGEILGVKSNEIIWTYTVDDGSGTAESISELYTRLTF